MSRTIFKKPRRRVERVFIHCSASDNSKHDNISTIKRWHLARGFSDIGYHFFIHKDGKISKGRSIEKTPAAQRGNNSGTIAICLHGLQKEKFTNLQFDAVRAICTDINNAYFKSISFHGHREVAAKACPVFDYKKVLKLDKFGSLGLDSTIVIGVENKQNNFGRINYGDRGDKVKELQRLLSIKADGHYSKKTLKAVKSFKRQHGLYNSGVVTKEVWILLKKPLLENIRIDDPAKLPDLKTGSRGVSVELLQELLFIKVDGIFGEDTAKTVRNFKEKHGYYPSDLVQEHIWKLLFKVRRVSHYE
ncbi:MAG: N-acetylmuramoyl-L-alanine amidase [Sulfurovum sp.]|nr:N-acetylmuramoyl-L-alanine amidase [Sulfurovaceae bacterium]